MIDVHMIPASGFEAGFEEQWARLEHPLIKRQVGIWVAGNVLEARSRSYCLGSSKYVSWVDPDDVVLDLSWIGSAVEALEADDRLAAVYPRWEAEVNGKIKYVVPREQYSRDRFNMSGNPQGHHLTIMRRSNIERVLGELRSLEMMCLQDVLLVQQQGRFGRLIQEPTIAYRWIIRSDGAHVNRSADDGKAASIRQRVFSQSD